MYKLSGVTKTYAHGRSAIAALRGVGLEVSGGEWLAVQGPPGHGKSTLLQILGGLDRPSSGVVEFDGRDLAQLRETEMTKLRALSIGFVFQTFNLVPTLSALENVEAALVPLRVGTAARRQRATLALEAVGLGDRLGHLPSQLSGGQQQRVAIARALVKEPKVLLADEPTGNLDEDTRDEIIALLETMWRERGLTMILVTHDSSIARRAQRTGVMRNGRLAFKRPRPGEALLVPATRPGPAGPQPPSWPALGPDPAAAPSPCPQADPAGWISDRTGAGRPDPRPADLPHLASDGQDDLPNSGRPDPGDYDPAPADIISFDLSGTPEGFRPVPRSSCIMRGQTGIPLCLAMP